MCGHCNTGKTTGAGRPWDDLALSRRALLRNLGFLGVVGLTAGALEVVTAGPAAAGTPPNPRFLTRHPKVHPRTAWAGTGHPVKGPLPVERPGAVKYLLCHHTENPGNSYARSQVPALLRGMYAFHTRSKGWNDIAYNFLVDKYGEIWEGRQGSLQGPVMPSATGGSQGYDQIVCWIGSHGSTAPTAQALGSMVSMLAWLADTYHLETNVGARTSFISRGSNRWPRGTRVSTRTIEGHRAMSQTTCPGDTAYAYLPRTIPTEVARLRARPA